MELEVFDTRLEAALAAAEVHFTRNCNMTFNPQYFIDFRDAWLSVDTYRTGVLLDFSDVDSVAKKLVRKGWGDWNVDDIEKTKWDQVLYMQRCITVEQVLLISEDPGFQVPRQPTGGVKGIPTNGRPGTFARDPMNEEERRMKHCAGCGKDISSSTGCVCRGLSTRWVPGPGTYGVCPRLAIGDHGGEITCPKCGVPRERASKNPTRCHQCRNCGDEAADSIDLIKQQQGPQGAGQKQSVPSSTTRQLPLPSNDNLRCSGCGAHIQSSTGCICSPEKDSKWVPSTTPYEPPSGIKQLPHQRNDNDDMPPPPPQPQRMMQPPMLSGGNTVDSRIQAMTGHDIVFQYIDAACVEYGILYSEESDDFFFFVRTSHPSYQHEQQMPIQLLHPANHSDAALNELLVVLQSAVDHLLQSSSDDDKQLVPNDSPIRQKGEGCITKLKPDCPLFGQFSENSETFAQLLFARWRIFTDAKEALEDVLTKMRSESRNNSNGAV